jgi:Ca-activated chloride channel family protein
VIASLADLHFLRPWALALLLPAGLLLWAIARRQDAGRAWRGVIEAPLLEHLLVQGARGPRLRPWHVLGALWAVGIVALAGPTWQREPSPFAEDRAALFIVLRVSPSMTAADVQPSRLERAVHKITDLLALRPGAKHGLVAYDGSAHLVMPLTRDGRIVETFASELSPDVMPRQGDAAAEAVRLARARLAQAGAAGSVLLIADGVSEDQVEALAGPENGPVFPGHILAVATDTPPGTPPAPALDTALLGRAADAMGGTLTVATPDPSDVERIASRIERSIRAVEDPDGGERWKDFGYRLTLVVAFLALFWSRKGWMVRTHG